MSFKNTKEIYQALIDGKKIRQKSWRQSLYIYLNENGNTVNQDGVRESYYLTNFENWEIYQEPKKKVKFYVYMDKVGTKIPFWVFGGYFRNDEEYKAHYPTQHIWTKKEDNFIEVEE